MLCINVIFWSTIISVLLYSMTSEQKEGARLGLIGYIGCIHAVCGTNDGALTRLCGLPRQFIYNLRSDTFYNRHIISFAVVLHIQSVTGVPFNGSDCLGASPRRLVNYRSTGSRDNRFTFSDGTTQ